MYWGNNVLEKESTLMQLRKAFISHTYKCLELLLMHIVRSFSTRITIIYVFFRLNKITTAVCACNAFTDSTGRNAHDPILLAGAPPAAAISMTITANELSVDSQEPWDPVWEQVHTHAHLMSIHSRKG